MGQIETSNLIYSEFIGEPKPNETQILRNLLIKNNALRNVNHFHKPTLWEAFEDAIFRRGYKDDKCLGTREKIDGKLGERYIWKTYTQVREEALNFAKGITSLKLYSEITCSNTKIDLKLVGIYSKNREEWVISDLGCQANSISVVTIYDTLGESAIEHILSQTKLTTIIIGDEGLQKIYKLLTERRTSNLANLILLDSNEEMEKKFRDLNINLYKYSDIIEKGKKNFSVKLQRPTPETILTVCYTSGTTSHPKGAMISNRALMSEIDIVGSANFRLVDGDSYISFLPLAHMMERLIIGLLLGYGSAIGFYSGNVRNIVDDCRVLKPSCICGVPKIYERIYDAILGQIDKLNPIVKKIVNKAISMKIEDYHKNGNVSNIFWDNLVLKKIRNVLGGRIRFMLTGSAPMPKEVVDFMKVAFSSFLIEGYGQTEDCCGMLLSNSRDNISGHAGGPGFANEVKLVDIPELNYTSKNINPETNQLEPSGEICIRGPVLFSGYLNDEEKTKEAVDSDGWLHTGDVGMIDLNHGNAVKVIDRVKNIFKLSQGEYVAPEKIENILEKSKFIEKIWIYGDSYKNYIIGFIVPNKDFIIELLEAKGLKCDKDNIFDYYENQEVINDLLSEISEFSKENDLKGFEIVKKIMLCKEEFSVDNNLVTPTGKIIRNNAKKYFTEQIKKMYQD